MAPLNYSQTQFHFLNLSNLSIYTLHTNPTMTQIFSQDAMFYVNIGLALIVAYIIIRKVIFPAQDDVVQENDGEQLPPLVFKSYTPHTLAKFNGTDDPRVLMGVKGKVYDVSAGKKFYGPGGPYENFAGRDASRGLAKNSFDPEMLTPLNKPIDTLSDLANHEIETLDKWEMTIEAKYIHCGVLENEKS